MLEICHTPNPTLNLPDSVGKCKTDLKTHVLMQSCYLNFLTSRFELFCRTIARDSKRSFSLLKYVSVLCELTRSTAIVSHISLKKFKEEHRRESWYLLCCEGATPGHLSAWNWHVACFLSLDNIDDELEMTMVCHRPEGLEQIESQTNFTKQELQVLYRGFKNVCCLVFLISSFSSLPHLHIYFTQMSFDTFWNLIRSL